MDNICSSLALCLFLFVVVAVPNAEGQTPPTVFVLGDSTVDVGTNSFIAMSQDRADFSYNGIDFPHSRPTGRFSNGYNGADFVARFFGLKRSPPPFLFLRTLASHQFKRHLVKGVNFASGGSGLLDSTGPNGSIVTLSDQINQFSTVRDNLTDLLGSPSTDDLLSKALFFISIGSNDIFAYFATNSTVPPQEYIGGLISTYATHITNLYKLGARKFGIIDVAAIGCCPSQRVVQKIVNGVDGCFEPENDFALAFHSALDSLLANISSQLPGFKYSLGNGYKMTIDIINNPTAFNFDSVDSACCGTGYLSAEGICNKSASLCPDRRRYMFWDSYHLTDKASFLAAQTLYGGPAYYVSPINFAQLAMEN